MTTGRINQISIVCRDACRHVYTRQKGGETAAHIARIDDLVDVLYFVLFFPKWLGMFVVTKQTHARTYIYVHITVYTRTPQRGLVVDLLFG